MNLVPFADKATKKVRSIKTTREGEQDPHGAPGNGRACMPRRGGCRTVECGGDVCWLEYGVLIRSGIEVSNEALAELCRRYGVRELSLFGSSARGDFRQDSDVDLLVEFLPESRTTLLDLADLHQELNALVGRSVDLVPKGALKRLIRDEVLAEARRLYAA